MERARPDIAATRPKFHYDWHWQWPYGNGDIGNQGVHQMDIARWGLGLDTLADSVLTYGGRFGYEDAGDTPNTEVSIFEFGPDDAGFRSARLKTQDLLGDEVGTILYGSEGYIGLSPETAPPRCSIPRETSSKRSARETTRWPTISAISCMPSAAASRRS